MGTNGGADGTGGIDSRLLVALLLLALLAYGIIQTAANVSSIIADIERTGREAHVRNIWIAEVSSLFGWAVMVWPMWYAVRLLRPPRVGWPLALAGHAAMTVPVSLAHVALMVAVRKIVMASLGQDYIFAGPLPRELLYEYRKDVATYVQFAILIFLIQWVAARYGAAAPEPREPAMLSVPDGAVTHHMPMDEIDLVEAAGNYVEIGWGGRSLLYRATLASLEDRLAEQGFVRIHRSRLVRRAAVRRIETNRSGDFAVELESGRTVKGSRRYREALRDRDDA